MSDAPAKAKLQVKGNEPVKAVAYKANYWEEPSLKLYYNSGKDLSVDETGSKKRKVKATAPLTYVVALQKDLIALGYLPAKSDTGIYDGSTKRGLLRFQRHAARVYRMKDGQADDVAASAAFGGAANGLCDAATAAEIQTWKSKGWVNPVGRFAPRKINGLNGKMRPDAADAWEAIMKKVDGLGGTLDGTYGDTLRPLAKNSKQGASSYSFHYSGRAADIPQDQKRYYVCQDPSGSTMYWRLYCKTDKQDGTQGKKIAKNTTKYWSYSDKKEHPIPEGYYMDLTEAITSGGLFERIKAHSDYKTNYNGQEWWHFQYTVDKQKTFEDELELIGFTEKQIRAKGWKTDAELDHAPG